MNLKKWEANFSFQKNEKYDDFGRFVHATQTNERNNDKNYLKCELDENNDVYLTSYYCGQKMNHTQISVEANGQTIKTNKGTFYSFNENGKTYEQLTFKNEADIISFNLWVINNIDFPSFAKPRIISISSSISCGVNTAVGSSKIKNIIITIQHF